MTPEIKEFLKWLATAKGLTVALILVFMAIFVWRNIDFITEISFTLHKPDQTKSSPEARKEIKAKNEGIPMLAVGMVIVPPAPRGLPSIVVFEIKNPGTGITHNVRVSIDLGSAKLIGYEVLGLRPDQSSGTTAGTSLLNIQLEEIGPKESIYVYAQTSTPTFQKIVLSSTDLVSPITYSYDNFREGSSNNHDGFFAFLDFLGGSFLLVMSVYLTLVLITWLNKLFKL